MPGVRIVALISCAAFCLTLPACRKPVPGDAQPPPSQTQPANVPAVQPEAFAPVEPTRDPANWNLISSAFQPELVPEKPSDDPLAMPFTIKRIARAWRYGTGAIVVLEKGTKEPPEEDWNRLFELYDFDLATRKKLRLEAKWPFWIWKFRQTATFEPGPAPDLVFEAVSCTECEPILILSSVHFDSKEQRWKLRQWGNGDVGVELADSAIGVDGSADYQALSGIADFQHVGHDQLAVWSHVREYDQHDPKKFASNVATLTVFEVRDGRAASTEIKERRERTRIKKMLCHINPGSEACTKPFPLPNADKP